MTRISRHKSHRSHKHRDRSESEDEGNSRDRKPRVDEEEIRVSRVSDQEKRKSSAKGKDDVSGDYGKRRKDDDRWHGGGDDGSRVEKESKKEGFEVLDSERSLKSKSSGSRRRDGSNERNEGKRRLEKESSRRESGSSRYKDGRERVKEGERDRVSEKDKKAQDTKHERSDDRVAKQGVEISEPQDEMRKREVEKELDRRIRRRDGCSDHDTIDDGKEGVDRQISYRDDHSKNGSYKDGRYKGKYREDFDRDQRNRDDKRRDERSSRTRTSERSESKHYRDENRMSESWDKKTNLQDSDRDGSRHVDDHSSKFKDTRGRKRSSDEIEDQNDIKYRSAKEPREETTKNGSSSSNLDLRADRLRPEHPHVDKVDSSLSNSRTKNSPNTNTYVDKDQNRHNSRQSECTRRDSPSGDARRSGTVSRDSITASGGRERIPESRSSEKAKVRDNSIHSDVLMTESHHDRIPRSDAHTSPNQLTEKHPSTTEWISGRNTPRRSLDVEGGQRSDSSKGGREREYLVGKPDENDISQEITKRDHLSLGPSSNRTAQLQGNSPGRLAPPPLNRFGANSPSVLGSYEDETRIQNGDPKTNTRCKRGRDASVGRGPGIPWKSSNPSWPSPVANGFVPLQHGPPPHFHPVVPQFPAPCPFRGRPPMDLNNTAYNIHEAGNRFPGHVPRPYVWHNSVDDCPPHLQMWDGNPSVFGNDWDRNRLLMSSRGWEMSIDTMWSGQNGTANMEFPSVPQKEQEYSQQVVVDEDWVGQFGNNSRDKWARSEQPVADGSGIKLLSDSSLAKQAVGSSSKSLSEKVPEPSKIPSVKGTSETRDDNNIRYCSKYLSKLDISPHLVTLELYEQCMSVMEAGDRNVTCNVWSQGWRKNNVESCRLVAKSKQHDSLFPIASDATFQRAMSLYRKQKGGMKEVMCLTSPLASLQNNPPESREEEVADASSGDSVDEDQNTAVIVEADSEKQQCDDKPNDAEGKGCDDKLSDALVFIVGSEESEAIMVPECRVNISRIHLSPESTH